MNYYFVSYTIQNQSHFRQIVFAISEVEQTVMFKITSWIKENLHPHAVVVFMKMTTKEDFEAFQKYSKTILTPVI